MLNGVVATVFGTSSFVGKPTLARLGNKGAQIVVAYRGSRYEEEKMRIVGGLGQVYYAHFHLKDEKSLYESMKHSNVVINMIGKNHETRNFSFNDVHVEGPRRMAKIARECGVKKFIHLSAMNVSPNPEPYAIKGGSKFLKSKYYGELAVREEFPEAVIIRPSEVLGESDDFLNHFCSFQRQQYTGKLHIWDYYYKCVKQPIYVTDLSKGIVNAITDESSNGKTYQAVGPYRYDFYDLIRYIMSCAGQDIEHDGYDIKNLRYCWRVQLQMSLAERLQVYPFHTWEREERNCHSDILDPKLPTLADLGVELSPLEEHIKKLAHYRPRNIRVEIPYERALRIEEPKRLNLAI